MAGQDGIYLARHLRALGYRVVGTVRELVGKVPVQVRPDGVYDLSQQFPTMSGLLELPDPAAAVRALLDGGGDGRGW